jgi:hypothetical protein
VTETDSRGFIQYLQEQASRVKHETEGNVFKWEEDPRDYSETHLKSADFLDVMYSEGETSKFVYMDRSTALDIVDRLKWGEAKIKSLNGRLKLMYIVALIFGLIALWGIFT